MYDFLFVGYCKYSSILYNFRVIWRWIISWIWNLGKRSLKVIKTVTIRKLGYGFLIDLRSNYGSVLYRFRVKAIYWSKIAIFAVMRCLCPSVWLSVCPSRSWIVSKLINISSKIFHHRVEPSFLFSCAKRHSHIPTGPPNGGVVTFMSEVKSEYRNLWYL